MMHKCIMVKIGEAEKRAFRYLLSNQPERFVLSVPVLICNGPKKVFQYFAEIKTRNFWEIIKKGHFEIFPGAFQHFRIDVYTTGDDTLHLLIPAKCLAVIMILTKC